MDFGISEILGVVGTAVSVGGSLMKGSEEKRASEFQRQQLERQEEETRIRATQEEAARRKEFNDSMESIAAIRAGRGVGFLSPTFGAFLTDARETMEGDVATERFNLMSRADSLRMAAEETGRAGKSSLLSGYMGAAGSAATGALRYSMLSKGGSISLLDRATDWGPYRKSGLRAY